MNKMICKSYLVPRHPRIYHLTIKKANEREIVDDWTDDL